MTLGVGNLVALICIVISIIFAIVTNQATNALWWALLAIFAVPCGEPGRHGEQADATGRGTVEVRRDSISVVRCGGSGVSRPHASGGGRAPDR